MIKKSAAFITFFILIGLMGGCTLYPDEEAALAPPLAKPVKATYDLYEVKRQTIQKEIRGNGTFIFNKRYNLSYKYSGSRMKAVYVKEGDRVTRGMTIAEIENTSLLDNIKQTESELKKAELRLGLTQIDIQEKSASGGPRLELQKAEINLELQKIDMEMLEDRLAELKIDYEQTRLTAPIDGQVTYVNKLREGDIVEAYSSIAEIADPSILVLDWQVMDSINRLSLNTGMEADIVINKLPYKGNILQTPLNFLEMKNKDDYRNTYRLDVINLPKDIKAGDYGQISVVLEKKDNVLVIPKNSVRTEVGRNYVLILEGSFKRERNVELGLSTTTEVEVLKGLEEGQKVILR